MKESEKRASGFRLETAGGTYEARQLVFTAGAWAGRLVPELAPLCRPERQTMLWTEPLNPAPFEPERFPIFVLQAPLGRYYGFPSDCGEDRQAAMDDAFIAAGFSGHGYKFCSVIGRIMADFCLGEEGKWGVEGFGLGEGRFG